MVMIGAYGHRLPRTPRGKPVRFQACIRLRSPEKSGLPSRPLLRRVHRSREVNDVGDFIVAIDAKSTLDSCAGLVADRKRERSQALRAAQHYERHTFLIFTISRYPYRGSVLLTFYRASAEKVGYDLHQALTALLAFRVKGIGQHPVGYGTGDR